MVISILNAGMQIGNGRENFYDEICRLKQNCAETEQKLIPHLPVSKLRQLTGLLYSPELPSVGVDVSVRLPVSLYRGALSQTLRAANAMHVNKSVLLTAKVVSRLMGEFQRTMNHVLNGLDQCQGYVHPLCCCGIVLHLEHPPPAFAPGQGTE